MPRPSRLSQVSARSRCSSSGKADEFERQPRIVERRAPRQQAVLLEHGRDAAAEKIEIAMRALVADAQRAFGRRFQPDHQIEEGGFAAAGLADDRHHLARRDVEIEPVDGDHRLPGRGLAKHLAQAAHLDRRRAAIVRGHARHRSSRASTRATKASSRNNSATSTMRPGEHVGDREQFLRHRQLMADAGHRADQFGDGDDADRQADIDLPAGEDGRHDRRQDELAEILQRGRPERLHHVAQFARHAAHGVKRVDQEHRTAHHHQHEADAEFDAGKPQHREQDPRHHRHRHQNADHRMQVVVERLRAVHRHRQRDAEHEGRDQRADHARQRDRDVDRRDVGDAFARSARNSGSRKAESPDKAPHATAPPRRRRRPEARRESAAGNQNRDRLAHLLGHRTDASRAQGA